MLNWLAGNVLALRDVADFGNEYFRYCKQVKKKELHLANGQQ